MFNHIKSNVDILGKALDGLWLRNKAISQNLSNVDTPNYKRLTVSFEDQLRKAIKGGDGRLKKTHAKHLPESKAIGGISPKINVDRSHSYRFDNNNVNIDTESADLAKNTIMYNAVVSQITDEFEKIKSAINEGSK